MYQQLLKDREAQEARVKSTKESLDRVSRNTNANFQADQENIFGERNNITKQDNATEFFDERANGNAGKEIIANAKREYDQAKADLAKTNKAIRDFESGKASGTGAINFQSGNQRFTPLTQTAFDKLIEQLKKPFAKAFKNLNVTTNLKEATDRAKELGENISDLEFTNKNGEVYGFKLSDGTIYINPEKLNANTAIHEFSHLWEQLMPSAWKKGVELFKQTKIGQDLFNKLKEEGNYSTLSDNELWSEALNTHVGNYGEWRHANPRSKMGQLKQWLTDTFNKLGEYFGFKLSPDTKLKNFTEGVVKDLLGGKPIVAENTTTDSDTKFNIAGEKGVLNSINKEQNSRNLVIAKEMDDKNISAEQITAVTG